MRATLISLNFFACLPPYIPLHIPRAQSRRRAPGDQPLERFGLALVLLRRAMHCFWWAAMSLSGQPTARQPGASGTGGGNRFSATALNIAERPSPVISITAGNRSILCNDMLRSCSGAIAFGDARLRRTLMDQG